jgi:uncharacterized protein
MSDEIVDNKPHHRYEMTVDGHVAYVAYSRAPGTITFIHTIVPEALAGKGIGSKLAKHVLDEARANGEKVIPQCPFVSAYIKKHGEYQDLVLG